MSGLAEVPARVLISDEVAELAGGANSLLLLLEHVDRSRFTPLLACPPGELQERAQALGVETISFGYRHRRMFHDLGALRVPDPRALLARRGDGAALARLARERSASLLHSNSTAAHLSGWWAAQRIGIPVVWHLRYRTSRLLYRFPRPDHMIFLSERFRDWALGARPRGAFSVIPNGIDAERFVAGCGDPAALRSALGVAPEAVAFCCVARLKPLKGQRELIAAFAKMARAGRTELWIVGEEMGAEDSRYRHGGGAYRRELEARARAAGIAGRVRFLGFRHDVAAVLAAADALVLPSHTEAAPRVVLEAMSVGQPVIATAVGGVPEQIEDEHSGLLVPPENVDALAAAMERLQGDAQLRTRLGTAGSERVRRLFVAAEVARRVESIWADLLSRDGIHRTIAAGAAR